MSRNRVLSRTIGMAAALLLAATALAGCGGTGAAAGIKVTDAWARPSSAMAAAGAAYMVIENTGESADALVGASSPAAATVEVHETYEVMGSPAASDGMGMESPAASDGMGSGMMGMRPIPRLEIPASGSVELKPGSYHIMLIGLTEDLSAGSTIEITLRFEQAGEVSVTAEVREG